ncbi:MAG: hypothetical protein K2X77_23815 [Candidatus Obscuribacterales bacterium]|nr:hypothetical protein [Candidatus Obscuribacterales bacterium]
MNVLHITRPIAIVLIFVAAMFIVPQLYWDAFVLHSPEVAQRHHDHPYGYSMIRRHF